MDQTVRGAHSFHEVPFRDELLDMASFIDTFVTEPEHEPQIVKIMARDEILRLRLVTHSRYDEMLIVLTHLLSVNVSTIKLKYRDDEGDWCLLRNHEDFNECQSIYERHAWPHNRIRLKLSFADSSEQSVYQSEQRVRDDVKANSSITISVKALVGEDVIRFKLKPQTTFNQLRSLLLSAGDGSETVYYRDDENEWIRLGGDADLEECRIVCAVTGTARMRCGSDSSSSLLS
jgi:hypothetical protein